MLLVVSTLDQHWHLWHKWYGWNMKCSCFDCSFPTSRDVRNLRALVGGPIKLAATTAAWRCFVATTWRWSFTHFHRELVTCCDHSDATWKNSERRTSGYFERNLSETLPELGRGCWAAVRSWHLWTKGHQSSEFGCLVADRSLWLACKKKTYWP